MNLPPGQISRNVTGRAATHTADRLDTLQSSKDEPLSIRDIMAIPWKIRRGGRDRTVRGDGFMHQSMQGPSYRHGSFMELVTGVSTQGLLIEKHVGR